MSEHHDGVVTCQDVLLDATDAGAVVACFEVTVRGTSTRCRHVQAVGHHVVGQLSEQSFTGWAVTAEHRDVQSLGGDLVEDERSVGHVGHHENGVTTSVGNFGDFCGYIGGGLSVSNLFAKAAVPCTFDGVSEAGAVIVGHVEDSRVGHAHLGHHVSRSGALDGVAGDNAPEVGVSISIAQAWVGGSVGNHGNTSSRKDGVGTHGGTGTSSATGSPDTGVKEGLSSGSSDLTVTARVHFNEFELVAPVSVHSVEVSDGFGSTVGETSSVLSQWTGEWVHEAQLDLGRWDDDAVSDRPISHTLVFAVSGTVSGVLADVVSVATNVAVGEEGVQTAGALVVGTHGADGSVHVSGVGDVGLSDDGDSVVRGQDILLDAANAGGVVAGLEVTVGGACTRSRNQEAISSGVVGQLFEQTFTGWAVTAEQHNIQ